MIIIIQKNEIGDYKKLDWELINNPEFYRRINNNNFLKKGKKLKDVYSSLIDELFPKGFKINETFTNKINKEMLERYEIEQTNMRALHGIIERSDYCLIDKGTLRSRKFCVQIEETLLQDILLFLSNNENDVIYYHTLFFQFEKRLNLLGITNRYYLKGVLDPYLPNNYKTKRDYISCGTTFKTSLVVLNDILSSINGEVTLEYLKEKFPGVSDIFLLNHIYQKSDMLICEGGKKLIKIHLDDFNLEFKNAVIKEIDDLFNYLKSPVITSTKIFSRIKINHPELLNRVPFINNHYSFYSLLTKIFQDCYDFRRPYISQKNSIDMNVESIIGNYLSSLDYFNRKIIDSFCAKMHLRNLYSFLDFIIEQSDMFIQIDSENFLKKEKFKINDYQLSSITKELNYYINSFGPIDTRNKLNFDYFPNIGFKWSKYLLVGVIRGFLNELFDIEYSDNQFNKTDFIIRRV